MFFHIFQNRNCTRRSARYRKAVVDVGRTAQNNTCITFSRHAKSPFAPDGSALCKTRLDRNTGQHTSDTGSRQTAHTTIENHSTCGTRNQSHLRANLMPNGSSDEGRRNAFVNQPQKY
jgi:hypothetical protein